MMRNLGSILLGCLAVMVVICYTTAGEGTEAVPVIEVETPTYQFDQATQGQVVKHNFRVFNRGTAPLEIKKVKPGWGCSVARFDRTIPPGGEGTISLEVNTKGLQGNISKTARVFSNDPKKSQLTIAMKGNVWAPIHLKPKYARLKGTVGEKIEEVVHMKGQKKEPLILKLASVSIPDKVEVELTETEKGRSWELKVRNKVVEQTTYNGQVKLTTNYPETPQLVIRFSGNIRPYLEVRPKTVSFGRLSKEKLQQLESKGIPMRRPVTVILNKGSNLKISKVELEKSLFKVAVNTAVRPGRIVTFQIEALVDKLQKGLNTDRLKIHTNQKDSEILEVPIRLEVL